MHHFEIEWWTLGHVPIDHGRIKERKRGTESGGPDNGIERLDNAIKELDLVLRETRDADTRHHRSASQGLQHVGVECRMHFQQPGTRSEEHTSELQSRRD